MRVTIEGLREEIVQIVREELAAIRHTGADSWLNSDDAAEYLGITRQRIHDLVSAGDLPRLGSKGERLFFKRSALDAYREGLL